MDDPIKPEDITTQYQFVQYVVQCRRGQSLDAVAIWATQVIIESPTSTVLEWYMLEFLKNPPIPHDEAMKLYLLYG